VPRLTTTGYLTPMAAIRAKCLDCCCGSFKEVTLCHLTKCSLHPYRFGKRPVSSDKPALHDDFSEEDMEGYSDTPEDEEDEETPHKATYSAKEVIA